MTKGEREKLKKAIWYFVTDEDKGGDWEFGMNILLDLLKTSKKRGMNQEK